MATYVPPKINTAYKFEIALFDAATGQLRSSPTIAAGDFKTSLDNGTIGNLATLPSVSPASGVQVVVDLSTGEMNGANIIVYWADQTSPKEWNDGYAVLQTTARQID